MRPLPPRVQRLLAGLGLVVCFVTMASIFAPDLSRATNDDSAQPIDPTDGLPHLGTIEDLQFRIDIHGGPGGPLYTVREADTGTIVGSLLTADEVAEWFPRIDLPGVDFSAPGAVMFAEPEATPYD